MGMFDYVHFEMPCPSCGVTLRSFQTKDAKQSLDTIEPDGIGNFYSLCKCKAWVEFSRPRPPSAPLRDKPFTREQVEAMGFVLSVKSQAERWPSVPQTRSAPAETKQG